MGVDTFTLAKLIDLASSTPSDSTVSVVLLAKHTNKFELSVAAGLFSSHLNKVCKGHAFSIRGAYVRRRRWVTHRHFQTSEAIVY